MLSWKTCYCCIHQFREVDLSSKLPNEWECSTWMPISSRGTVSVVAEERRVTNMATGILSILSGFPHAMCIWPAVTELKGFLHSWEKMCLRRGLLQRWPGDKGLTPIIDGTFRLAAWKGSRKRNTWLTVSVSFWVGTLLCKALFHGHETNNFWASRESTLKQSLLLIWHA